MPTQSLKKNDSKETLELTDDLAVARTKLLAQKLVRQVMSGNHESALPSGSEEENGVILDLEVDGVRCLLIRTPPKSVSASVTLSPREHEIARMIAKGYPNKTIAAVLDISAWTVCTHIRRIFAKLGVGSRAAMVARLVEEGAIGEERLPAGHSSF